MTLNQSLQSPFPLDSSFGVKNIHHRFIFIDTFWDNLLWAEVLINWNFDQTPVLMLQQSSIF